jgi:O-acetyl-ADP-ribose deacetylase (regulator of RNase III)
MSRSHKHRLGPFIVNLIEGDIAQVKADALITAINSDGIWFGGVDAVIRRVAGQSFHDQVRMAPSLKHTQTIAAKRTTDHHGSFGDVLFVIDDLKGPLHAVIIAALTAAEDAGYKTASLPAIRTGVMLGIVEKDTEAAAVEIVRGISAFSVGVRQVEGYETAYVTGAPTFLKELTLVTYRQPEIFDALDAELKREQD